MGQHGRVGLFGAYSTSTLSCTIIFWGNGPHRDFTRNTLLTVRTYIINVRTRTDPSMEN